MRWIGKAGQRLFKAELKHKSMTYAGLVDRLAEIGVDEKEVNIRSKLARRSLRHHLNPMP